MEVRSNLRVKFRVPLFVQKNMQEDTGEGDAKDGETTAGSEGGAKEEQQSAPKSEDDGGRTVSHCSHSCRRLRFGMLEAPSSVPCS